MQDTLLVGTRKGLFTVSRRQGEWKITHTDFLGDNVALAMQDRRTGLVHAALDHGHFGIKMHRADGLGAAWEERAAPAYPEKPEDLEDTDQWDRPTPWSTQGVWALETGGEEEAGVLWCGTLPGGLFRSEDNGESWSLIRSLWDRPERRKWFGGGKDHPGLHSVCVDPRDPKRVLVAVSCGGVWLTEDGGETWETRCEGMWADYMPPEEKGDAAIQDPHQMTYSAADPDVLWVQHHNGIFRSTDGAKSWRSLDGAPTSFGFAVAAHPKDPKTAWFAPAVKDEKRYPQDGKLVISRTRDGGESFEILRDGLPQEHAYDLVYRHALDVDDEGERLAFGSTTGGFWVSENGGEQWMCVSQSLPPIYSVRFA